MKLRILLSLFVLAFRPALAAPPAPPAAATPPANRYLFIVDTCDTGQSRFNATLQAVRDLLNSGICGQAREGDTLGLWTFNESASTSHFTLQRWSAGQQRALIARI